MNTAKQILHPFLTLLTTTYSPRKHRECGAAGFPTLRNVDGYIRATPLIGHSGNERTICKSVEATEKVDGKWIVKARKDSTIRAGIVTVTVE